MIERILDKNHIDHKSVGTYLQIRCLDPGHEDKNPSMFVNKYTGWANCKSCGASLNLFEKFNEKPNRLQVQRDKLREKLRKTAFDSINLEIPDGAVFFETGFRGISSKTIRKFQAFQTSEHPGYLFFPLRSASGRISNFIGRDTTGTRTPKYIYLHKKPIIMAPEANSNYGSIILVEGWFDFLNLYDKGLTNARAIFGANTFREEFLDRFKIEGIDEVIIMLDGDEAGRQASEEIKEMLDREYINNKVVKLPNGTDPGDMSEQSVLKLKEKLYGKSGNSRDEVKQKQLQS